MALEVDGDHVVELLLAHVEQHPLADNAGHAGYAVDGPPVLDRRVDDALANLHLGHVSGHGDRRATGGGNLGHHSIGYLAGRVAALYGHAVVGHHHVGPFARTGQGDGPADAVPSAGDGDVLSCEVAGHGLLPVGRRRGEQGSDGPSDQAATLPVGHRAGTIPPSTVRHWPVMKLAASDAMYRTAPTISSGSASRFR